MALDALNALVLAYGEFLENGDYSEAAASAVFSEDARVTFAIGGIGTGLPEIAQKHQEMMAAFTGATHNITNVIISKDSESSASVSFHMEVIHQFKPEIAEKTPGDLFICNDRIKAGAVDGESGWRFLHLEMNTLYKRMAHSVE